MPCRESGVSYRMVFQGQPVEGFLDLVWTGILWDPEQPIVVFHPQKGNEASLLLALRGYPRVVIRQLQGTWKATSVVTRYIGSGASIRLQATCQNLQK